MSGLRSSETEPRFLHYLTQGVLRDVVEIGIEERGIDVTDATETHGASGASLIAAGDRVQVRALKANGEPYRWWWSRVESIDPDQIATINRIGDVVESSVQGWQHRHDHRNIYWFNRPYNLWEVYEEDGRLKQLYVHIASPPVLEGNLLEYIDYELDVIWRPGRRPRVADDEEFAVAIAEYGYSKEFQASCWRAVDEALHLVTAWQPQLMQPAGDRRVKAGR